ncbi:hypothetical protein HRI96_05655 [Treponema parvum]|uniref:DUF4384 domain-containing protein n=1 Tax=Treponema parvum TaxID=138851 RepID=A0A975ICB3_9SPIR|nr:hypothetical protein [Treponema parvum]QTQ11730.1 hypothetical protein HRI96_05655 [Treponema parvum]
MKRFFSFFVLCFSLLCVNFVNAQAEFQQLNVDFYGVYSSSGDKNMIDMTRNLYFAQLKEMNFVTVKDKSADAFFTTEGSEAFIVLKEPPATGTDSVIFFVEIETSGNGNWKSILHAQSQDSSRKSVLKKEYTSYYKILTEAKSAIEETLRDYMDHMDHTEQPSDFPEQQQSKPQKSAAALQATTESIAGTWQGENFIDKIVILRGGRGFIIYKNGATMNILVSVQENADGSSVVSITQAGKSNASFFPELPRKTALENAPTAAPLEWLLTLTDLNTMQGSKKTLVEDKNAPTGAAQGTAEVTWTRK